MGTHRKSIFCSSWEQKCGLSRFLSTRLGNIVTVNSYSQMNKEACSSVAAEKFVEALCKMENLNPFQVFEKFPGIYLLLVYPNEQVWECEL